VSATTVDQVARAALSAINSDAGLVRAVHYTSHRYRELTNDGRLRSLRKLGELIVPAIVDTGTVDTTRDSNVVTGDSDAQGVWTSDLIGRYFRATSAWYKVSNVIGGELRLESTFAETAVDDGGYDIVPRFIPLPPEVRYLGTFVHTRLRRKLQRQTAVEMDWNFPDRILSSNAGPQVVVDFGRDDSGNRVVEIYPYSTTSEIIHYVYWERSPDLHAGDLLPYSVDEYALKEGVLVDLMRYASFKAAQSNQVDIASFYRNDYRAQETKWDRIKRDMLNADKGSDDVTFVLRRAGLDTTTDGIIRTAREEVWARGDRP
jgi:hypothetical protein